MLFFFLVSLVLNVIFNNIGSCSVSHCSNVSPITPEFTTPKLFFNLRVFFEDFSRSYVFYNLHHSRRRMFWLSPQQKDVRDHHRIYIRQVDIRFWEFLLILFLKHCLILYLVQNWLTYEPNLTIYINNELFLQ